MLFVKYVLDSAVIDRDYQIDDKIPKKIKPRRLVE